MRVFENRVVRRICGPRRDKVTREWRKLLNEELNELQLLTQYCSGGQIEKIELGRSCSTYEGHERRVQGFGGET